MRTNYFKFSLLIFALLLFVFLDIYFIGKTFISEPLTIEQFANSKDYLKAIELNYELYRIDGLITISIFLIFSIILIALIAIYSTITEHFKGKQLSYKSLRNSQLIELSSRASSGDEMTRISAIVTLPILSCHKPSINKIKRLNTRDKYLNLIYEENPYVRETLDILSYTLYKETKDKVDKYKIEYNANDSLEVNLKDLYKKSITNPSLIEQACCDSLSRITENTLVKSLAFQNNNEWVSAIDLNDKQLIGLYLESTNLAGASFARANLMYSSLYNSNLSHCDLQFSYLGSINLAISDLTASNLTNAFITNSDLRSTYLCESNFFSANLSASNLSKADLTNANLTNANLSNTNLYGVIALPDSIINCSSLELSYIDSYNYNNLPESIKSKYNWVKLSDIDFSGLKLSETIILPIKDSFLHPSVISECKNLTYKELMNKLQENTIETIFAEDAGILIPNKD